MKNKKSSREELLEGTVASLREMMKRLEQENTELRFKAMRIDTNRAEELARHIFCEWYPKIGLHTAHRTVARWSLEAGRAFWEEVESDRMSIKMPSGPPKPGKKPRKKSHN